MPASFLERLESLIDSGNRRNLDGCYTVFRRGDEELRACRCGLAQEVVCSCESSEDDLETKPIIRASKMMRSYGLMVVNEDGVDVYYLPTLRLQHLDSDDSWNDVCAATLNHTMIESASVQDIEHVGLPEDERKPAESGG